MDKVTHFTAGMIIFAIGNFFIDFAIVPVIIAAIGKEIYDLNIKKSRICMWDALSTIAGGLLIYLLIVCLRR